MNHNRIGKGVVIIGAQFGDEGKGKIVDYYTSKSYIKHIVRFNGGANAGHTIVVANTKYALHLLPSGMVFGKLSYIGNGVSLDLEQLESELNSLNDKQNKDLKSVLKISERVHLVLPIHKKMDIFQEEFKKKNASGSTKRGVGPSYSDKANRIGIRFIDLFNEQELKIKIGLIYDFNSFILTENKEKLKEEVFNSLIKLRDKFEENMTNIGEEIEFHLLNGDNVLFEGAQSTLLDIDHGVYPFCTSSTCIAAGASSGTGVGIQYLEERIGVVKAFTSRVGGGPVIGELDYTVNPGKLIQTEGHEFGTTTGRPRRIAWLDLVALKYSTRINGFTGLALTKLDILGLLDNFYVITAYKNKKTKKDTSSFPADIFLLDSYEPVLKEFQGWGHYSKEDWLSMMEKGYFSFPKSMKMLIAYIEDELKVPIYLLGLGPERKLTFEKKSLDW